MEVNFNLGSLKIISKPLLGRIEDVINLVRKNIEAIGVGDPIKEDVDGLFLKLKNSFLMIGLGGVVEYLSINQKAFDTAASLPNTLDIYESLIKNLDLLKMYINGLLDGELDNPIVFYESYKNIGSKVNIRTSVEDLFSPRLDILSNSIGVEVLKKLRVGVFFTKDEDLSLFKNKIKQDQVKFKEATSNIIKYFDNIMENKDASNKDYYDSCKSAYEILGITQNLYISKSFYVAFGLGRFLLSVISPSDNVDYKGVVKSDLYALTETIGALNSVYEELLDRVDGLSENSRTGSLSLSDKVAKNILLFVVKLVNKNEDFKNLPAYSELIEYFNVDFYASQLKGNVVLMNMENIGNQDIEKFFIKLNRNIEGITASSTPKYSFNTIVEEIKNQLESSKEYVDNNKVLKNYVDLIINYIGILPKKLEDDQYNEVFKRELAYAAILLSFAFNNLYSKWGVENTDDLVDSIELSTKRLSDLIDGLNISDVQLPLIKKGFGLKEDGIALRKVYSELSDVMSMLERDFNEYLKYDEIINGSLEDRVNGINRVSLTLLMLNETELALVLKDAYSAWLKVVNDSDYKNSEETREAIKWIGGVSLYLSAKKEGNEEESPLIERKVIDLYKGFMGEVNRVDTIVETPDFYKEENTDLDNCVTSEIIKKEESDVESGALNDASKFSEIEDDNKELRECFYEELNTMQNDLVNGIKDLTIDRNNIEALQDIRRVFHTIKGSGRMILLNDLGEFAWHIEELLNRSLYDVESGSDSGIDSDFIKALDRAYDLIYDWKNSMEGGNHVVFDMIGAKKEFEELRLKNNNIKVIDSEQGVASQVSINELQNLNKDEDLSIRESLVKESINDNQDIDDEESFIEKANPLIVDEGEVSKQPTTNKINSVDQDISLLIEEQGMDKEYVELWENLVLLISDIPSIVKNKNINNLFKISNEVYLLTKSNNKYAAKLAEEIGLLISRLGGDFSKIKDMSSLNINRFKENILSTSYDLLDSDIVIEAKELLNDIYNDLIFEEDAVNSVSEGILIDDLKEALNDANKNLNETLSIIINNQVKEALREINQSINSISVESFVGDSSSEEKINEILTENKIINQNIDKIINEQIVLKDLYRAGVSNIRSAIRENIKKKQEPKLKNESILERIAGLFQKNKQ